MELDEKLRARLRALAARAPEHGLDEPARARVRARLLARRPARDARRWQLWLALPAAAALAGWLRFDASRPHDPRSAAHQRRSAATGAPQSPTGIPECARDAATDAALALGTLRVRSLELARARVVQASASSVVVEAHDRCELGFSLARGELAVHARALRGGSLWVESPLGRVQVRGTVFSVAFEAGRLRVAVAEGTVAIARDRRELARVRADQVCELRADGTLLRGALSERERARLLAKLALAPARERSGPGTQLSAPDAGTHDTDRERVWREGAAPAFAPQEWDVPTSVQPDGRPMKKPRLVE